MNSTYQYIVALGSCMGWNGPIVAAEIVANGITALALFLLSVQLIYLLIMKPRHLWIMSSDLYIRVIFTAFLVLLGLHRVMFIINLFYPNYIMMIIVDSFCALFSLINAVLIRNATLTLKARV